MNRRLRRSWVLLCIVSLAIVSTRFAAAAPNDAAAQKLRDQAIEQDYLLTNYAAAEKKLNDALALCQKTSDCSPFIRARVHCDLGVVELMLKKVDLARTEFATALMEDPNVGLDPNLSNSDAQREFAAVKGGGASGPAGPATGAPGPGGAAGPAGGPAGGAAGGTGVPPGQGGIIHTPATQQAVRTPLPLYVQVPEDIGAAKVIVRYRLAGARDWKSATMRPMEGGFGVEIPCGDVGDKEGELDYYVQALDSNGDLVAASGRSATPHKVAIVKKVEGEPPHFPGQNPPKACPVGGAVAEAPVQEGGGTGVPTEASDCPPGFPGCHEAPTSCDTSDDCASGESCVDHACEKPEAERKDFKKNWLSLGVQAEDLVMNGANDACAGGAGYACFNSGTSNYYAGVPALNRDDKVLGGFASSPMLRVLIGYDRVVLPNITLGGRVGYAFFGAGPQRPGGAAFMPIHLEARFAYWFGKNVFSRKGLRFFFLLAGGMTEVDASQAIDVFANARGGASVPVDAWTKTGLGFGAAGFGGMFAITRTSGVVLEVKGVALFPTFGIAPAVQLAYAVGL